MNDTAFLLEIAAVTFPKRLMCDAANWLQSDGEMKTQITSRNLCLLLIVTALLTVPALYSDKTVAAPLVSLTAATNKPSYYIREPVVLSGTINESGQPAMNYLVSIEVDSQSGDPLLFRTILIGNPAPTPPQNWQALITAVYVKNSSGTQTNSIGPIGHNIIMSLCATVQNNLLSQYSANVTGTVFDGNLLPIATVVTTIIMAPNQSRTVSWSIPVPEWAYSGEALVVVNLYNNLPEDGGTPLAPEVGYVFYLTRNSAIRTPYSVLPAADTSAQGQFGITFGMPPNAYTPSGTYNAYATAISPATPYLRSTTSTFFNLIQYSSPPQAAFTFTPLQIYGGMDVTFDASSSSAEGPNVTITQYEWTIDDPNNPVHMIEATPTLSHIFAASGTYVVQLNVTNSVGLWSTTSKPVVVLPDYGPIANFTWTPTKPSVNRTAIFDASSSQVGWSSQIPGLAPITSYTWNFGDGTPINTTSSSTIQHVFTQLGNYSVTINVTDSVSRTDQIAHIVQVVSHPVWDVDGDGKTDIRDISFVAKAFGSTPGSTNWNPIADLTGPSGVPDGKVDIKDISLVAKHFGEID